MKRSRIVGTGSYVPSRVVGNQEVAAPLGLDPDQIVALTGIQTRYWVEQGQASSDLAVVAGQRACEAAGMTPQSVDAILVSTTSPDSAFPSTACYVQHALGANPVMAFDLSASCSGFLYGVSMADVMIRSGQVRSCLVIAAEVKSRFLDARDRETVRVAGGRTFILQGGTWVDTAFDPEEMKPVRVGFLSKDYFDLAQEHPDLAAAFALGPAVIVLSGQTVYAVMAEATHLEAIPESAEPGGDAQTAAEVTAAVPAARSGK